MQNRKLPLKNFKTLYCWSKFANSSTVCVPNLIFFYKIIYASPFTLKKMYICSKYIKSLIITEKVFMQT